jgi:hypothetical protein
MNTVTPMFPPRAESPSPFEDVDVALLRFVRCLIRIGLTLEEAGAVVSAELERAEALASKRRPRGIGFPDRI